jgi:sirohydrochlorin cobaltochelatase
MEQAPFIAGVYSAIQSRNLVVVPFFVSDGLHVVEDIPVLLGEPASAVKARLESGLPIWRNPTERHGKRVWYAPGLGAEPLLAEVILERVREAATWQP